MSLYDNEIYRGPPESAPTLANDTPAYGAEFYVVKPPETTARQDVPPTEEAAQQERKPTVKKKSKITKALKLLASCTTAVLAATVLTVPLKPTYSDSQMPLWSRFGPVHGDGQFSFSAYAQNSDTCQVSIGSQSYCLTAQKKGLYLQWHETYDVSHDGSSGGFYLCMEARKEGWVMILDFNINSLQKTESDEGLGQIQTDSGDLLYVRGFYTKGSEMPLSAQQVIDDLDSYIQISAATDDGWDNVFIGDTMYSETNEHWNGFQGTYTHTPRDFRFRRICYTENAAYSPNDLVIKRRVNDIDWSFYFSMDKENAMLWSVPSQEDIAFGYSINDLYGIDSIILEEWYSGGELGAIEDELAVKLNEDLLDIIDYIIECGLQYYHLAQ